MLIVKNVMVRKLKHGVWRWDLKTIHRLHFTGAFLVDAQYVKLINEEVDVCQEDQLVKVEAII